MSGLAETAEAPARTLDSVVGDRARWRQVGVFALVVVLTRLPGLLARRSFNTDENTLGVGGRGLADGGSLYLSVIDRKPPLPFLAYRIFGTNDLRVMRAVVAVLVLVAALVVAEEARRRWGERAGWISGLVLVLGVSALGPADAQAANFELFALVPIVVSVVAAARGRSVAAGVALAVAVLCKQPAAVTIVPVAWLWWQTSRWQGVLRGLAAGGVATLALAAPFGLARVLDWALLGTGGYLGMHASDIGFALVRLAALASLAVGFWGGAWLLAAAPRRGPAVSSRASSSDVDVWLLLGASLVGVVAGFRFFPHYLVQLLPALALLAGRGVTRRPTWARPALVWGVAASVVAAALSWPVVFTDGPRYETELAQYARTHTAGPDEILVWGNQPEIYWLADRQPAGGFTHSEFFTGYSGGRRPRRSTEATVPDPELYRTWITRLRADPPALVIDTAAADERGGKWYPITGYPALVKLLRTRYQKVATIRRVPVYRRIDQEPSP